MSDTDDTDNLLLIPPDLFTIHSDAEDATKPYGPYYKVVDSLITQVNKLENRVNSISTDSSVGNSLDNFAEHIKSNKLMSGDRHYSSLQDLPQELRTRSNQNTPQKSKNKHRLNSLPNTPNTVRYSPAKSKSHVHYDNQNKLSTSSVQNEMLNEIDTFISNVKTIQKFQAARNLNLQFSNMEEENLLKDNQLNLKDVDKMLDRVESQKREISSRIDDKKQELCEPESVCLKENTWIEGNTIQSVPNRGMGMREFLYKDSTKSNDWEQDSNRETLYIHEPKQNYRLLTTRGIMAPQNLSDTVNSDSVCSENHTVSTESTPTTAYQTNLQANKIHLDAAQVLNNHKKLLSHNTLLHSPSNDKIHDLYSQRSNNTIDSEPITNNNLALLNLSELWHHSNDLTRANRSQFINKLQEEKLRRQHCENLIQNLQMKTLELQERLAVAIQVDKAKDKAISQIHKSWEESVSKIDHLCSKNSNLEQLLAELKNKFSQENAETVKKLEYYERESSKALNLAHNSQERVVVLEKENNSLIMQLQTLEKRCKVLQEKCNAEQASVLELSKILSQKEAELNESKSILADARKEVSQSKKAVEICQTELTSMRITQVELERQLNEEVDRIKEIEKEKRRILADIESHKKIEKSLRDELNKQKEKLDQNKIELKNFYQDQVEVVVREKLHEFQLQLEKAENSLQEELRNRELAVAKSAAMHIQQITEKHALEIHLLEEKQKEEIKLYNLQLSKAKQQIENLQSKFYQHQERKSHIAQQLHKVMEAQWLEALKIINSKSPIVLQDKSVNTMDQLNSLKSKSFTNLEEILLKDELRQAENVSLPKSFDDQSIPMITTTDTPLTTRSQKTRAQLDQEMQKYIQMLLSKSPRNLSDQNSKLDKAKPHSSENPGLSSQNQNNYSEGKSSKMGYHDRLGKPPWK